MPSRLLLSLLVALALLAGCGGGGRGGDEAVCEASLVADDALNADIPDEELLLSAFEEADVAADQAGDEILAEIAAEAGVLATTARLAIDETGSFSDELFDDMVVVAEDLSARCGDLGL